MLGTSSSEGGQSAGGGGGCLLGSGFQLSSHHSHRRREAPRREIPPAPWANCSLPGSQRWYILSEQNRSNLSNAQNSFFDINCQYWTCKNVFQPSEIPSAPWTPPCQEATAAPRPISPHLLKWSAPVTLLVIVNTFLGAGKHFGKRKTEEVKPIKEVSGAWVTTLIWKPDNQVRRYPTFFRLRAKGWKRNLLFFS